MVTHICSILNKNSNSYTSKMKNIIFKSPDLRKTITIMTYDKIHRYKIKHLYCIIRCHYGWFHKKKNGMNRCCDNLKRIRFKMQVNNNVIHCINYNSKKKSAFSQIIIDCPTGTRPYIKETNVFYHIIDYKNLNK